MLLDRENLFSYKQAVTVTAASTDKVWLGDTNWAGTANGVDDLPVTIAVDEPFTAAGAATLTIQLRSSMASDMSSPKLHQSVTIAKADLASGGMLSHALTIPEDVLPYVDVLYTVGTGPFTAGKITCGLVASRQTNK